MRKYLYALLLVLVIGLILRTFKLDARPMGLTWDEAALGYNAYSLLHTGRDEHAQFFPIVFKSFGDYKPGLYIYMDVLPTALFGLNVFATRLPSALFGTLLIAVVFLLTKAIWKSNIHALSTAFLFAVNPWAIHFSRGAWEANLSLLLTTLGTLLFLKKRFNLSMLLFGLTLWSYQGAKLFTPLILVSLLLIYKPKIISLLKPLILFLIIISPVILGLKSQSGRLQVFSLFSYSRTNTAIEEILRQDHSQTKNTSFFLFHSESLDRLRGLIQRYLNHFSPRFLFIDGDWSNPRHSTPFYGYMHLPELLTLILGVVTLLRSKSSGVKLMAMWLILAPIPSALSRDIVSGVRSLPMVIPLVVISGMGLARLASKRIFMVTYICLTLAFLVSFLDYYFIHYPFYFSQYWMTPYQKAVQFATENKDRYSRIVFSNSLGQPYIFFLFYNKVDPNYFFSHSAMVDNKVGDVGEVTEFDRYHFGWVDWPAERNRSSVLMIGDRYEIPDTTVKQSNLFHLAEFPYQDGKPGLYAAEVR